MQDRPDLESMLAAVAHFLDKEAVPAATDPALSFRLRIAAHLVATAAREVHSEGSHDAWQLAELESLLAMDAPLVASERRDRVARRQAIRALERVLVERIDAAHGGGDGDDDANLSPSLDAAALADYLRGALRRRLAVANPRFDLSPNLP